jgi:hypothetical protein
MKKKEKNKNLMALSLVKLALTVRQYTVELTDRDKDHSFYFTGIYVNVEYTVYKLSAYWNIVKNFLL